MQINKFQESIRETISVLRLTPFDTATSEGRDLERKRRVALTATSSAIAQFVKILIMIITVPLLLEYLGIERYGMWLTISSVIALVRFADFGIGNGLLNAISEADGMGDIQMALRAVSSALLLLSFIALLLGLLFAFAYQVVAWERVLNVSSSLAVQEAGPTIAVFGLSFLISMPLAVVQKTQIGYQEGFWNDLWLTAGNILGLVGIMLAMQFQIGTPGLVLALVGAPVIALFINGIVLFHIRRPWLSPRLSAFSKTTARRIAKLGIQFFVLSIAVAVAYTSDRIVIAQIMGAEAVPLFAIPQRLFAMISMLIGFILVPLWPAYGEALAQGDLSWIRMTLLRSLRLTLLVTIPASLFFVIFGSFMIETWVGEALFPPFVLLLGLGLWTVISSVGNAFAMALNGMGIIRVQVILAIIMALANIVLSILLTFRIGIAGPIWASVITYSIIVLIPLTIYIFFFKITELEDKVK